MMLPIQSSMLSEIGWAEDTLYLRYNPTKKQREAGEPGSLYRYPNYIHGLPDPLPESWGVWFNANIKGKYTGEKVEPEPALVDGVHEKIWDAGCLERMVRDSITPDSISITKTPVEGSVQAVMPEDAKFERRSCGIGDGMEEW